MGAETVPSSRSSSPRAGRRYRSATRKKAMIGDLISFLHQSGSDLVEIVNDVRAAATVYKFGTTAVAALRGYIGPTQEENLRKIGNAARDMVADIDRGRLSEPSPSVLTPIVEAACQESREGLQERWACLLANAVVDKGKTVRGDFTGILAQFDPQDAVALTVVKATEGAAHHAESVRDELKRSDLSMDDYLFSREKLQRLGLVRINPGTNAILLVPAGRLFLAACSRPSKEA